MSANISSNKRINKINNLTFNIGGGTRNNYFERINFIVSEINQSQDKI